MSTELQILNRILEHRLHQTDIDQVLAALSGDDKSALLNKVGELLRRMSALMEVSSNVLGSMDLDDVLGKLIEIITETLIAERSTLFLHDEHSGELFSFIAQGELVNEIRFTADQGIAGAVFSSGTAEIIADPYADSRFNREVDRQTGFTTRNILCVPVTRRDGKIIGVTQVLNKRTGAFTLDDQSLLEAMTTHAANALESARLFEDVLNARNYSENILRSLSTGVITLDAQRRFIKLSTAACRILRANEADFLERDAQDVFSNGNAWIVDSLDKVMHSGDADLCMDTELKLDGDEDISVNLSVVPLLDVRSDPIGFMLIIEDISSEKRIRSTMARYMTKEVADRLLEEGESVLGGTAQKVTVLFSDIRGFTNISEQMGARETVSMLNDYFSEMVEAIFENKGILDKYIGDAIMALFGAPFANPGDADNALATACRMMQRLWQFNALRAARGHSDIVIGIGINTGEVIAGNIGTEKHTNYKVIGDGVNLAARLESANKHYGTRILISEKTRAELERNTLLREIDRIRVKGKSQSVAIYEALDYHTEQTFPNRDTVLATFTEGLNSYRRGEWDQAARSFGHCLLLNPADRPSDIYKQRCHHYQHNPPPTDWDGV